MGRLILEFLFTIFCVIVYLPIYIFKILIKLIKWIFGKCNEPNERNL